MFVPPILLTLYASLGTIFISPYFNFLIMAGLALFSKQLISYWNSSKYKYLKDLFQSLNIKTKIDDNELLPEVKHFYEKKDCFEYYLSKPPGITIEDLEDKKYKISDSLGKYIKFENAGYLIKMIVYKQKINKIYEYKPINYKNILEIPLGISNEGPISFKFNDQNVHLLVGGITGSGKSNFILQCVTNLIINNKHSNKIEIYLVDLKRAVEAQIFKDCKCIKRIVENIDEVLKTLEHIEKEMKKRYEILKKENCININNCKVRMPKILVIVNELVNIRQHKQIQEKLIQLLAQTRAIGIHFILATQRPDYKIIDGAIKANISATLAFAVRDRINSQILLDNDSAVHLNNPGRAILQTFKEVEIQIYYIDESKIKEYIKPFEEIKKEIDLSGVVKIDN